MRKQIGTVKVTRRRIYNLDPEAHEPLVSTVVVEPGDYPVYQSGISHYWRLTGFLNENGSHLGDRMFRVIGGDNPSGDDVIFYSKRFGPDEFAELLSEYAALADPPLVFSLTEERK